MVLLSRIGGGALTRTLVPAISRMRPAEQASGCRFGSLPLRDPADGSLADGIARSQSGATPCEHARGLCAAGRRLAIVADAVPIGTSAEGALHLAHLYHRLEQNG